MVIWDVSKTIAETNRPIFSQDNLTVTVQPLDPINSDNEFISVWTESAKSSKKWYWEIEISESSESIPAFISVGIARQNDLFSPPVLGQYSNGDIKENGTAYRSFDGKLFAENVIFGPIFGSGANNVLSFLMDLDNHTLDVSINNSGFIRMSASLAGFTEYYPYLAIQHGAAAAKFGDDGFNFSIPAGFDPINAEFGTASILQFSDVIITNSGSSGECEKTSGIGPDTTVEQSINTFRLNHRKLNGNLEEPVLISDNDISIQEEIVLEDKNSGRLKG